MKINKIISILFLLVAQPSFSMSVDQNKQADPLSSPGFMAEFVSLLYSESVYGRQDLSRKSERNLEQIIVACKRLLTNDSEFITFSRKTNIKQPELKILLSNVGSRAHTLWSAMKRPEVPAVFAPDNSFLQAAIVGDLPAIRWYLGHNINLNEMTSGKETALSLAANKGQKAVATLLIKARVNLNLANNFGYTPLHFAIANNHLSIARELIAAGADVNVKDWVGVTPLMLAASGGHADMVRDLIAAGARVTDKDKKNRAAVDYARSSNHHAIVTILTHAAK